VPRARIGNEGAAILSNLFKETTVKLAKQATGGTIAANVFLQMLSFIYAERLQALPLAA
jgi:hypothetical protein